jgi:hypothetical protein
MLDGARGAQETGHRAHPDQGAIVMQHGETADCVLEQQLPLLRAPPRGQPWTTAVPRPHGRDGLRTRQMAVV